ncbi:hypothetical protein DY000_02045150 [Brassica cretica]|uniref:Uncharacterized protein n=1 Tax=Brassica cretica TaxID=69181 RepID=A0ABQ7F6M4_BRACR|nr:hypothetical protein DY000_02045150 [Brassica cretica]
MKVNGEKVGSPSYLSVGKEKESVLMEDSGDKVMDVVDSEESAKKLENGVSTSGWAKVSPAKTGRSFDVSAQKIDDVEISALKFFVLSLEDVEEGELVADEKLLTEVDDDQLETEDMELLESDQAEDIDQQVIEEKKVGLRRGRKAKVRSGYGLSDVRHRPRPSRPGSGLTRAMYVAFVPVFSVSNLLLHLHFFFVISGARLNLSCLVLDLPKRDITSASDAVIQAWFSSVG